MIPGPGGERRFLQGNHPTSPGFLPPIECVCLRPVIYERNTISHLLYSEI